MLILHTLIYIHLLFSTCQIVRIIVVVIILVPYILVAILIIIIRRPYSQVIGGFGILSGYPITYFIRISILLILILILIIKVLSKLQKFSSYLIDLSNAFYHVMSFYI